jgi:hypothetical protein
LVKQPTEECTPAPQETSPSSEIGEESEDKGDMMHRRGNNIMVSEGRIFWEDANATAQGLRALKGLQSQFRWPGGLSSRSVCLFQAALALQPTFPVLVMKHWYRFRRCLPASIQTHRNYIYINP